MEERSGMEMKLDELSKNLLKAVSGLESRPIGAFSLRANGRAEELFSTRSVTIRQRADGKPGMDVLVAPGSIGETVYAPVLVTETGICETVYNDYFIGEGAEVTIVAGCGIHNCGDEKSEHDGVHTFTIGKNARMKYVEKHYGEGTGRGDRVLNPVTQVYVAENGYCELEMVQMEGVSATLRNTTVHLARGAKLQVVEKLLTQGSQTAVSNMDVYLDEEESSARIVSRSVAQQDSVQEFHPVAIGNQACRAHVQCDSIIMDRARVRAIPEIAANHEKAEIVHEAAIGRINNDQLIKLQTLGLDEEEAEKVIIDAFLE